MVRGSMVVTVLRWRTRKVEGIGKEMADRTLVRLSIWRRHDRSCVKHELKHSKFSS